MGKFIDLTGQRFERLVVLERTDDYITFELKKYPRWRCQCDCGEIVEVLGHNLREGRTRSCGCLRRETGWLNGKRLKGRKHD